MGVLSNPRFSMIHTDFKSHTFPKEFGFSTYPLKQNPTEFHADIGSNRYILEFFSFIIRTLVIFWKKIKLQRNILFIWGCKMGLISVKLSVLNYVM